jgi:uncharacterized membrane protein (UPF0127 family)
MPEIPAGKTICIKDESYEVSFAQTGMELMTGLKGLTSLEPYAGMLFDFGVNMSIVMTPKGCLMDLDVAFISNDGKILEIKRLNPDVGLTQASSTRVRYALEVPAGFFELKGIVIGDVVTNL